MRGRLATAVALFALVVAGRPGVAADSTEQDTMLFGRALASDIYGIDPDIVSTSRASTSRRVNLADGTHPEDPADEALPELATSDTEEASEEPGAAVEEPSGSGVTWELTGSVTGELRIFPDDPEFSGQDNNTFSPSVALQPELFVEWNGGDDRLTLIPFGRLDAFDDRRSHYDIREANYLHSGDGWDLLIGNDIVFWGTTEARHLVNIINQTDQVEDIDEEDKLGQPMVNLNLLFGDYGRLGAYLLPYFRERTFPGSDARLRGPVPIDADDAIFESGAEERHIDFAFRYDNTIGPVDFGISHFQGTTREPELLARLKPNGETVLIPFYEIIDQTSLDVQAVFGSTLLKLEALTRGGQGERFYALVGGFEYTFFDVFGTGADIGLLSEYLADSRDNKEAPNTSLEDDVFVGTRLARRPVDFGISHFQGTTREPELLARLKPNGETVLIPFYEIIDQTSLDVQAVFGSTLLKLEALTRGGQGERFYALVGGFEYTFFDVFGTGADIGLLSEYLADSRDNKEAPNTSLEDDVFVGTRLALNDEDDTNLLAGAVIDVNNQSTAISIEADRRIFDSMRLAVEARIFVNVPPLGPADIGGGGSPLSGIRQDSFIQTRLSWFF